MKMFTTAFVCILAVYPDLCLANAFKEPSREEITKATETFKFRGQWISPRIIKEFLPWESDHVMPLIHSLDVSAAAGTNRFSGKIMFLGKNETIPAYSEEGSATQISYEWVGRLKNGMHVLVTKESGDGSMVATGLMILSLKEGKGKSAEGKTYRQLLGEIERFVVLGDRAFPHVSISDNTIKVKTEFNGPRKPETKSISLD